MNEINITDGPNKWDLQTAIFGTGNQIPIMFITIDGVTQPEEVRLTNVGHVGNLVNGTDFQVTFRKRWGNQEVYTGRYNTGTRTGTLTLVDHQKKS